MSTHQKIELDYTLEMQSNFHIGGGGGIAELIDRAVARLANGELLAPGSTIKGRVRYRAQQLAREMGISDCGGRGGNATLCKPENPQEAARDLCLTCRLFGSEWQPATLYFSDARLSEPLRDVVYQQRGGDHIQGFDYQTTHHTRTRIDRRSRRVVEGALYTFEEGVAGLLFQGRIQGSLLCVTHEDIQFPLELLVLLAALRLVDSIGGKKTVGLGRCRVMVTRLNWGGKELEEQALNERLSQFLEQITLYDDYRTE